MYKAGADVLIRATVMPDGRLMVAPGAVIEPDGTDILGDVPRGKGLGEAALLMMYFRSEQDRQRFANGLYARGSCRGPRCSESGMDEPDGGPHFAS